MRKLVGSRQSAVSSQQLDSFCRLPIADCRQSPRGFTLIELVIALIILSIAIAPLAIILGNMVSKTVMPEVLNVSNYLAERELERITALRFSAVLDQAPTNFPAPFSNYSYQVQLSAVPAALADDPGRLQYKQVAITIRKSNVTTSTLTTVVTNNP